VWKVFGERLDGFSNDDHPSEPEPGAGYFALNGERVPTDKARSRYDLDFLGLQMPPPEAIAGTYKTADGKIIKVPGLTDEDRFTLVRWIDLGCPIDLDRGTEARGLGWFPRRQPSVTVTPPRAGQNPSIDRILIGAHDYWHRARCRLIHGRGRLPVNGIAAGQNLAPRNSNRSQGVGIEADWAITDLREAC
jgi:hypothetical protein